MLKRLRQRQQSSWRVPLMRWVLATAHRFVLLRSYCRTLLYSSGLSQCQEPTPKSCMLFLSVTNTSRSFTAGASCSIQAACTLLSLQYIFFLRCLLKPILFQCSAMQFRRHTGQPGRITAKASHWSQKVCSSFEYVSVLQVVNDQTYCFVNETLSAAANTTTTACDPPLAYQCSEKNAEPGVYAQQAGPVFDCSTVTPSPALSPEARAPLPVLPAPAGTPVNDRNYTYVFQANETTTAAPGPGPAVRYAKTAVLEAGQVSFPRPPI